MKNYKITKNTPKFSTEHSITLDRFLISSLPFFRSTIVVPGLILIFVMGKRAVSLHVRSVVANVTIGEHANLAKQKAATINYTVTRLITCDSKLTPRQGCRSVLVNAIMVGRSTDRNKPERRKMILDKKARISLGTNTN